MSDADGVAGNKHPLRSAKSAALGLFVLAQLAYLLGGNALQFFPRQVAQEKDELSFDTQERGRTSRFDAVQVPIDGAGVACDAWSDATGIWQGWKMFTTFPHQSVFPVVILEMPDGRTVRLESPFLSGDPDRFFRVSDSSHRYYNAETRMSAGLVVVRFPLEGYSEADRVELRKHSVDWVRRMNRSIAAFLSWRTDRYLKEHPESPLPRSAVLGVHFVLTPEPGQSRAETGVPFDTLPLARWRPGSDSGDDLPLEAWDFDWKPLAENRMNFVRLPREELVR